MKQRRLVCLALSAAAGMASVGTASAAAHPAKPARPAARQGVPICPVTGEKVTYIGKGVARSRYKGKTYFFCCPECKPMFDKDPARYLKKARKGAAR